MRRSLLAFLLLFAVACHHAPPPPKAIRRVNDRISEVFKKISDEHRFKSVVPADWTPDHLSATGERIELGFVDAKGTAHVISLLLNDPEDGKVDGRGQVGFRAARSHAVVPTDSCLVTHPLLDELIGVLRVRPARTRTPRGAGRDPMRARVRAAEGPELRLRVGVATGERQQAQLEPRAHVQLAVDRRNLVGDGAHSCPAPSRDVGVARPGEHVARDLELRARQERLPIGHRHTKAHDQSVAVVFFAFEAQPGGAVRRQLLDPAPQLLRRGRRRGWQRPFSHAGYPAAARRRKRPAAACRS